MNKASSTSWPVETLGNVAEINPRQVKSERPEPDMAVSFVPMAAISEVSASISDAIERPFSEVARGYTAFRNNDVLFAKITPCMENGKVAIARNLRNDVGFGSTEFHVIRAGQRVMPEYLWFFMRTRNFRDEAKSRMVGAGGQQRVPADFISSASIPLPPLPEQHRIVEILDQADALRQQRREADGIAKKILPALFDEMFGDIVRNSKRWPTSSIGECTDSRLGKMLDRGRDEESDPQPYLANLNVRWGEFDLDGLRTMDFSESDRREFELKPGDVLVCEGGEVGRSAIWRTPNSGVYFQKALHRVRVDPQKLTPEYLQFFLYSMAMNGGLTQHVGNSIIGHLTGVKLKQLTIPLPPLELQRKFSVEFLALEGLSARFSSSSATLETLFQTLLHRAFNGSLTAKWREAHAKELLQEMEHQAR